MINPGINNDKGFQVPRNVIGLMIPIVVTHHDQANIQRQNNELVHFSLLSMYLLIVLYHILV